MGFMRLKWNLILLWHRVRRSLGLDVFLGYIGGAEVLPPPLTADEESLLIEKLQEGDPDVKSVLIERNIRLVVYIARKFENTGVSVEDLVSIGCIGLIKAISTFDPSKKIKLATYASKCIENEILMYLRRTTKTRAEVSFEEPLNVDAEGNELCLGDVKGTDEDVIYRSLEREVDRAILRDALDRLPWRERTIVDLRFGLKDGIERTQKQVADMLGISQSYISRLEKKIMQRLHQDIMACQ